MTARVIGESPQDHAIRIRDNTAIVLGPGLFDEEIMDVGVYQAIIDILKSARM